MPPLVIKNQQFPPLKQPFSRKSSVNTTRLERSRPRGGRFACV
jgi:hypothetical protein